MSDDKGLTGDIYDGLDEEEADADRPPAPTTDGSIKHPEVVVQLTGQDGNAFSIIGRVRSAMRRAGIGHDELEAFQKEAMSGTYDTVLQACLRWVTVR
jgi:hypothetical protein